MKILIVRLSSLGDVIHNLPLVHDILQYHPHAHIDWVVEKSFAPLLQHYPGIHQVIPLEWRHWRKNLYQYRHAIAAFIRHMRTRRYDVVMDAQGLIKSAIIGALPKSTHYIGYANGTDDSSFEALAKLFYRKTYAMPRRIHAVDRARLLCARHFGHTGDKMHTPPAFHFAAIPMNAHTPHMQSMPIDAPYWVLLHASSTPKKAWPYWVDALQLWQQQHPDTFFLLPHGNDQEQHAAFKIQQATQQTSYQRVLVLPKLDLLSMQNVLAQAKQVVGVDTGLTHLASALGRPVVCLYARDIAWRVGAYWAPQTKALYAEGGIACLSVADVMRAFCG